jgi:hypothetical protein
MLTVVLLEVRVRGPSLVGRPPMAGRVADTVTVNGGELTSSVSVVVTMTPAGQHRSTIDRSVCSVVIQTPVKKYTTQRHRCCQAGKL